MNLLIAITIISILLISIIILLFRYRTLNKNLELSQAAASNANESLLKLKLKIQFLESKVEKLTLDASKIKILEVESPKPRVKGGVRPTDWVLMLADEIVNSGALVIKNTKASISVVTDYDKNLTYTNINK